MPKTRNRRVEPLPERLLRKRSISENGCWEWTGHVSKNGYGMTHVGSRSGGQKRPQVYVHRESYRIHVGAIPDGMDLDHLCRNRKCFNPDHLEPVTRRENVARGIGPQKLSEVNGSKRFCKNGHEFTEENTIRRGPEGRWRRCRACEDDRALVKKEERRMLRNAD